MPRYFAVDRVPYHEAPCRFVDMDWKPDRPDWWDHWWQDAEPLEPQPELPLRFELRPYRAEHPEMGRALPLMVLDSIPLMRRELVDVLEAHGARLQTFPAVLVDPDDGSEHEGYLAVNVLGLLPAEALGRFAGRISDTAHTAGSGFTEVQPSAGPHDGLVLAWIEDTHTLVVFEPLKNTLVAAGFDELAFTELTRIAT